MRKLFTASVYVGLLVSLSACGSKTDTGSSDPHLEGGNVAPVTFLPRAGIYFADLEVVLRTFTLDADIYYTTDGSTPSKSSTLYEGPVAVSGHGTTTTIKAIALREGFEPSLITESSYSIIHLPVAQPLFSPAPGTYTEAQEVALTSNTDGATIYYTTDGSDPTSASTPYSAPIAVGQQGTTEIRAIAVKEGRADSPISSGTYVLTQPPPSFAAGATFTAHATSKHTIDLAWDAATTTGSGGTITYDIFYATNPASFDFTTPLASVAGDNTFQATSLDAGTTYHFALRARTTGSSSVQHSTTPSATTWFQVAGTAMYVDAVGQLTVHLLDEDSTEVDTLDIESSGGFEFENGLPSDAAEFAVVIAGPAQHYCWLANASGTVVGNIGNISLRCHWTSESASAAGTFYVPETDGGLSAVVHDGPDPGTADEVDVLAPVELTLEAPATVLLTLTIPAIVNPVDASTAVFGTGVLINGTLEESTNNRRVLYGDTHPESASVLMTASLPAGAHSITAGFAHWDMENGQPQVILDTNVQPITLAVTVLDSLAAFAGVTISQGTDGFSADDGNSPFAVEALAISAGAERAVLSFAHVPFGPPVFQDTAGNVQLDWDAGAANTQGLFGFAQQTTASFVGAATLPADTAATLQLIADVSSADDTLEVAPGFATTLGAMEFTSGARLLSAFDSDAGNTYTTDSAAFVSIDEALELSFTLDAPRHVFLSLATSPLTNDTVGAFMTTAVQWERDGGGAGTLAHTYVPQERSSSGHGVVYLDSGDYTVRAAWQTSAGTATLPAAQSHLTVLVLE